MGVSARHVSLYTALIFTTCCRLKHRSFKGSNLTIMAIALVRSHVILMSLLEGLVLLN